MPQTPTEPVAGPHAAAGGREDDASVDREWLREFDAQHRNLAAVFVALVARIRRVTEHADGDDSQSELLQLIAEAEHLLPAHFAFEEAGGYLCDALAVAPRLSKRAAHLHRDHREFAARFALLAASAREPQKTDASWELLVIAIQEFTEELRLHELEENRLIQEAFVDDLGGG